MRVVGVAILALAMSGLACGRTTPVVVPVPPELPAEPTQPPLGASRFNPAPSGTAIQIDGMSLYVTDVVFPADTIVRDGNLFNPTPEPGSDYILVGLTATCDLPPESSCRLSGLEFSLVDTAGIAHNPRLLLAGVPGKFEGGEFFGGSTRSGYLIYLVEGDPAEYILKYQALFGGEAYLTLE
jgi:hypothetical protein